MPSSPATLKPVPIGAGPFQRAHGSKPLPAWQRRLKSNVMLVDAIAIYAAVTVAYFLRWGLAELIDLDPIQLTNRMAFTAMALLAIWFIGLALADAWDIKIMGSGATEYARVSNVTFAVFSVIAIASYLAREEFSRSYVAIALPLGLVFLNFGRWIMRQRLVKDRIAGKRMSRALLIAPPSTAEHLVEEFERAPSSGLKVVAVCTPSTDEFPSAHPLSESSPLLERIAVNHVASLDHLDSIDAVIPYALASRLDTVIVSGVDELSPRDLKRLSWALEPHHIDLVIAPKLTDISATRMVMHNVAGVQLIHVENPGYTSQQQHIKRIFDLIGSSLLIAVFAIPMGIVALIIRISSLGPVLFKQSRVGMDGQEFKVFKFRSMYPDAEARLKEVLGGQEVGLFYKPKNDPRITPIGKFIRRYSIDELPQLFNVWRGEMSLVGPRPQIPAEVALYEDGVERRLFVKPGMTGLWQVSGRNNLSVDESMRLDLYYTENWSLTEDMLILARTAKAVLGRDGAY